MAEIIRLPFGIPGVGREGDCIVHDPDHPDPKFRLVRFSSLDVEMLPLIRERITREVSEGRPESYQGLSPR